MFYLVDTVITSRKQTRVEAADPAKAVEAVKAGQGAVLSINSNEQNNARQDPVQVVPAPPVVPPPAA